MVKSEKIVKNKQTKSFRRTETLANMHLELTSRPYIRYSKQINVTHPSLEVILEVLCLSKEFENPDYLLSSSVLKK